MSSTLGFAVSPGAGPRVKQTVLPRPSPSDSTFKRGLWKGKEI